MNNELQLYQNKLKENIKILIEQSRLDEAKEILNQYETIVKDDIEIYSIKAVIAMMEGDAVYSEKILNEGLLKDENNFDLLYNKAYIMNNTNRKALAKFYYYKALGFCKDDTIKNEIYKELNLMLEKNNKIKLLIGSPIHQKRDILKEFLISLEELDKSEIDISYFFIDDNVDSDSSRILNGFCKNNENAIVESSDYEDEYVCDSITHNWKENLIWKVAAFKNRIIQYAIDNNFDYLFLIDSDIVLHPKTLKKLISDNKDIVSNIFWTKWQPDSIELPQVWVKDTYTLWQSFRDENITDDEKNRRTFEFLNNLRKPGVYEVGGLGACTLISRNSLIKGVSFSEIKNLSFWGEDRHFCIRATALGLKLYVDTEYPAYHIYREGDLIGVKKYKRTIFNSAECLKKYDNSYNEDLEKKNKYKKRSLNILQLYDNMKIGGAETHIITLAKQLKALGNNVYIAAPLGPAVEWIKRYNLTYIECNLNDSNLINELIEQVVNIVKTYKIDVIHAHPYISQVIGAIAAKITNVPVTTTLHSTYDTPIIQQEYRGIIEKCICVSDEVKQRYILNGFTEEKLIVINNSVEIIDFPKEHNFFENKTITFCYISRLDSDKISSLMKLLKSVDLIKENFEVQLYIVGEGTEFSNIKCLCDKINFKYGKNIVNLVGGTVDTEDYIKKSDIIIGVGRVILEAIAAGKFAICIGNKYYPGRIDSEKLAQISEVNFTDRNNYESFSEHKLLNDINMIYNNFEKEFEKLKETYYTVKSRYSIDVSAEKHLKSYFDILASSGSEC